MDRQFTQTFLGAVLVSVVGGIIVASVTRYTFSQRVGTASSATEPRVGTHETQSLSHPPVQRTTSPQDADIANAFRDQSTGSTHLFLGGTAVARPYALQIWGDENVGGQALLEQASSTGWTLVSNGGGEWDVLAFMEIGVPQPNAEQLVATINNGALPAPALRPMEVPTGDTITIAIPAGNVVTKNFYRSAAYLATDRHSVVIRQAPDFDIVYDAPDSHFIINLFLKPVKDTRRAAEAAFLEALNISEVDACKVTVHEFVTGLASRIYPQSPLPLSFCTAL